MPQRSRNTRKSIRPRHVISAESLDSISRVLGRQLIHAILAAALVATLAGCGSESVQGLRAAGPSEREPTRAYIDASQRLLQPPGELASLVVASLETNGPRLDAQSARDAVSRTRDRIAILRAVAIRSSGLRAQRARLISAIGGPVIASMDRVAAAAARNDGAAARREGRRLLQEIKELPSHVEG